VQAAVPVDDSAALAPAAPDSADTVSAGSDSAVRDALGFGPAFRLHTPAEFAAVFAHRRVLRGRFFNLHYRPNDLPHARIGFVVAKKLARRAVLRNLIKRIGREEFRLGRAGLPDLDLVVRLSAKVDDVSRKNLHAELLQLLGRLPRPR